MDTLIKCKCQHCDQNIEFEAAAAGRAVNCPGCGMETQLFDRSAKTIPRLGAQQRLPKPGPTPKQRIKATAKRFTSAAIASLIFAGVSCLMAAIVISSPAVESGDVDTAVVFSASVVSVFLGAAGWFYLIAQIIHIRANTEKE